MFRKPDGAGKGDAPRPIKDQEQFSKNWDEIFKKKEEPKLTPCQKHGEEK